MSPQTDEQILHVSLPLSLITDTNLSDRELFLIRRLYIRHQSSKVSSCVGVLLQHLWSEYGSIFSNKSLLYAALAFESYWNGYSTEIWSPSGTVEYHSFKSRFNISLMDAIRTEEISECHFFALFLASQSSKSGINIFKEDLAVYQQGMVKVLRFLGPMSRDNRFWPLQQQHSFILSFTRRILCRGDFSMPEYLVADVAMDSLPSLEVKRATNRFPIATSLSEMQISSHSSQDCHDRGEDFHKWDYWNDVVCCLCKEFEEMAACFQILVNPAQQDEESYEWVAHTLNWVRRKVDNMLNLHDVSYVFRCVHPICLNLL